MVAEPPPPAADQPATARLPARFAALRRRWRALIASDALLRLAALVAAGLAAVMLLDWLVGLPRAARAVALVGLLAAGGSVAFRRLVRPLRSPPDNLAFARRVERRHPELAGRLRATLELAPRVGELREGAGYVRALAGETARLTAAADWRGVIPADRVRRLAWRVLPALLLVLGLGMVWRATAWPLLQRALLVEVARPLRTRIVEVQVPVLVGRGDDVPWVVRAEGILPRRAFVEVEFTAGGRQRLELAPVPGRRGVFSNTLAAASESLVARARAGDGDAGPFPVEVVPRPAFRSLAAVVEPPAYTGLGPTNRPLDDLVLLRGSRVMLEGELTGPVAAAELQLAGLEDARTLAANTNTTRLQAEFTADDPRLTGFRLALRDPRGITSRDDALYRVQLVADRPPQVRLVAPARREELATARATIPVGIEARDDYGVGTLRVVVQPADVTNAAPHAIELDLEGAAPRTLNRRYDLALPSLNPPPQPGVLWELWVEAEDRNTLSGPGVGRSERRIIRVVTDEEKRADLLSRANDSLSTLNDVADGQEKLNQTLGRVILQKPTGANP
ncbi:MAG: DUF4175 family protein [Limisphaerales bacterium]